MGNAAASSFGFSKLQTALQERKPLHAIQSIVRSYPESIRRRDLDGQLPLHYAAYFHASAEVVQLLVNEYREALQEQDDQGCLPLHYAAMEDHLGSPAPVEVVRLLVDEYREGLEVQNIKGWLPLHYATRKNSSEEVVRLLVAACPRTLFVEDCKGKLPVDGCRQKKPAIKAFLKQAMIDYERMPAMPGSEPVVQHQYLPAAESNPTEVDLDDHLPFVPFGSSLGPPLEQERERVRRAVEHPSHEPALVSVSYVDSIKTQTFLGDGFFGTVFKGSDPVLGRDFAIKSINVEILRGGTQQELEDAMKTFKTEQEVRE